MKRGLTACKDDLIERLETISALTGKIFYIETPEKLQDQAKMLVPPYAGVLYAMTKVDPDSQRGGHSHTLVFTVYVAGQTQSWGGLDDKDSIIGILDEIFDTIVDTKAPSGHKWRFTSQQAAGTLEGMLVYEQTWEVHNIT